MRNRGNPRKRRVENSTAEFKATWRGAAAEYQEGPLAAFHDQNKTETKDGALRRAEAARQAGLRLRFGPVIPASGKLGAKIEKWSSEQRWLEAQNWHSRAVGVALGERDGLVVVRVEPNTKRSTKLLPTFTVRGANGAEWLWYRVPAGAEAVHGCTLGPGAALLGRGDYALADPFECFEGEESTGCSEVVEDRVLAELPSWVAEKASQRGALTTAHDHIARGWAPLPVLYQGKGCKEDKWQSLRITADNAAQYFSKDRQNVGVLLGEASNGLTDVDLDCPEAVALAAAFLPATGAVFGRASKRRSHRLFYSNLHETETEASRQFKDTNGTVLLELRTGGGGKGAQTVFPGSTHVSGESVEWDERGEPSKVDDTGFLANVHELAAAVLLARHWPLKG